MHSGKGGREVVDKDRNYLGFFISIIKPKEVIFLCPLLASLAPGSKSGSGASGHMPMPYLQQKLVEHLQASAAGRQAYKFWKFLNCRKYVQKMLGEHKYDQYLLGFSRMTEPLGDTEHSEEHLERTEMIIF